MNKIQAAVLMLCWLWSIVTLAGETQSELQITRTIADKPYEEVLQDIEFAIQEHNFRITGRNDIGKGIREFSDPQYPLSVVIHFCNLRYAEEALTIDPGYVVHMPCRIMVYQSEGKIKISTFLLDDHTDSEDLNYFAEKINHILQDIVDYASSNWDA